MTIALLILILAALAGLGGGCAVAWWAETRKRQRLEIQLAEWEAGKRFAVKVQGIRTVAYADEPLVPEVGAPWELVRPDPPRIRIIYRLGDDGWTATSPDIDGLAVGPFADHAECQHEAIRRVREWAHPGVMLELSIAEDDPE